MGSHRATMRLFAGLWLGVACSAGLAGADQHKTRPSATALQAAAGEPALRLGLVMVGGSILDGGDSLDLIGQDAGVLFLSTGNELVALPKTGGPRRVLWRGEQSIMAGAVGDDRVYATTGGELISVPKRGGAKDVLARAEILLDVVVLDGWVYLARNESHARGGVSQTAALLRLPAEGGDVEELPGLSHLPAKLAACGSGVYVIDAPLLGRPGAPRLLVVK